jgi:ribonucleoside-diphosphate reductase alpha chain
MTEFAKNHSFTIDRIFSNPDVHPYEEIQWNKRDAELTGMNGKIVFSQKDVKVPSFWSDTAFTIAAQKYFKGVENDREKGIDNLIDRVVKTITKWGIDDNYFSKSDGKVFEEELTWLLVNQYGAFNSPVWFNVGLDENPQCSACFILKVEDSLDSILKLAHSEAMIFKGGSGSGMNFSPLRSTYERLSGGGIASGPVQFMKGFDSFAGVIKSGGKTRRAAKMVILNADHPNIMEFISSKIEEEAKAKALVSAGYDGSFEGEAYCSVCFQNANHSVRVTDEFMNAVVNDENWNLKAVTTGEILKTFKARELWQKIAHAAHSCGDPGIQFDTTINKWHTCLKSGRINASNPCSEFMFIDESACNLSSLNLLKFLDDDGSFLVERFVKACELLTLSMEILVDRASYPTTGITENSKNFRPLGLGYTNLGGLLMTLGLPYDSDEGRGYASSITALMTGTAYAQSAKISRYLKGTFAKYDENRDSFLNVIKEHKKAVESMSGDVPEYISELVKEKWEEALNLGTQFGYRNAQVSLLAPTGTIGFLMDSDSTGIEPMVALVLYKQLAGGGSLKLVTKSLGPGLTKLGYGEAQTGQILKYLEDNGSMEGAPFLKPEHLAVFDTALRSPNGTRTIHYKGHLNMMAAVQPFLSGAISKTVNLPGNVSTVEIGKIYEDSWKMGLKSVAIYREGSKGVAPLSTGKSQNSNSIIGPEKAKRKRLPDERLSMTHKFEVGGHKGYLTVGYYEDGTPGELFIAMAKEGSTISGLMDAFAIALSVALQHGVPLKIFCEKYMYTRFEPSGITTNSDIPMASSLLDYIFRWLVIHHKDGVNTNIGRRQTSKESIFKITSSEENSSDHLSALGEFVTSSDAPICSDCGFVMVRNGSCYKCMNCGSSSGCS